jgi:predicted TIM-barrel fold metal-dependent hydrolase
MTERLTIISADGHVGPLVVEYRRYVDPELRAEYDRYIGEREEWRATRNRSMGLNESSELVDALFGEEMVALYDAQSAVASGGRTGVYDSARRNAELEGEGIVAEVLFADFQNSNEPPWGAAFPFPDTTPELRVAGARAFNRWLADFCAELGGRRAGVALVQPDDVDLAVAEVHWVRAAGLASVMLPTGSLTLPGYHDPRYDPVWAACVDEGLPVTFHSGGTPWEGYGPHAMWVTKMEFMWWARRPLWQLVFGGVFERFPDLRVAFTEQGMDWIPAMLGRMDDQYRSPFERGITEHLHSTPSEYWAKNCYVGASFMSRGEAAVRDAVGVNRIMWGADYPHIEGTWPHSVAAMRDAFAGCSESEIRQMTSATAAEAYGFDLARLDAIAADVGPAVDDVVGGAAEPPVDYAPVDYALGKVSGMETGRRLLSTMIGG